jgi:hypothetical protein
MFIMTFISALPLSLYRDDRINPHRSYYTIHTACTAVLSMIYIVSGYHCDWGRAGLGPGAA